MLKRQQEAEHFIIITVIQPINIMDILLIILAAIFAYQLLVANKLPTGLSNGMYVNHGTTGYYISNNQLCPMTLNYWISKNYPPYAVTLTDEVFNQCKIGPTLDA